MSVKESFRLQMGEAIIPEWMIFMFDPNEAWFLLKFLSIKKGNPGKITFLEMYQESYLSEENCVYALKFFSSAKIIVNVKIDKEGFHSDFDDEAFEECHTDFTKYMYGKISTQELRKWRGIKNE